MGGQWKQNIPLYVMILPAVILVAIFAYGPMVGIVIAFQKFIPTKGLFGSQWVGWDNFDYVLSLPTTGRVIKNTLFISIMKVTANIVVPVVTALLLNEIRKAFFKRALQTIIYFPHFLSWVILSGILIDILSPTSGIVNQFLGMLGLNSIYFLGDENWFPFVLVISDVWKEFGFNTIVYLAALTGINPALYESAVVDGATRIKQTIYITLPGMLPIIILMSTLGIGNVLNAGFDQVFNLYSPSVYATGDIIDTFVYRTALINAQFDIATAVGLLKSIVSFGMLSTAYFLAYRLANYRIF